MFVLIIYVVLPSVMDLWRCITRQEMQWYWHPPSFSCCPYSFTHCYQRDYCVAYKELYGYHLGWWNYKTNNKHQLGMYMLNVPVKNYYFNNCDTEIRILNIPLLLRKGKSSSDRHLVFVSSSSKFTTFYMEGDSPWFWKF